LKVVADTPWPGHGDIAANPRPAPNTKRIKETAAATKAPAMMAGQEAADLPGVTAVTEWFK